MRKSGTYTFFFAVTVFMMLAFGRSGQTEAFAEGTQPSFTIHSFEIAGNTLLSKETLSRAIKSFTGKKRTAQDVEHARDALEQLYHRSGYPTVLVNIPEQTVDDGVVRLEVIESRIRRLRVVGNQYFTMEKIKSDLASMRPGKVLYLPQVKAELSRLNRNPDLKISPILIPGKELGTIDIELKVEDKLPLHGSLEVNNRSSHTTTATRVNALLRYDNLWQKEHSVSVQFQTSPEDTSEVMVFSGSYAMPLFYNREHMLIAYALTSDSETASGVGFNVIGKGKVAGVRYMMPLGRYGQYNHNFLAGIDYKDFEEDSQGTVTPITYVPFSFGYAATLTDKSGIFQFSSDLNFLIRDLFINDMDEFQAKRSGSTGNYIYLTLGLERRQKLPLGCSAFIKVDGQLADQPLISNEQYAAGGVASVRGYKESEIMGDNALHTTVELYGPSLFKKFDLLPYLFYDGAWLGVREALPGEWQEKYIQGAGIGIAGGWLNHFEYKLDLGFALEDTDDTDSGDFLVHFKVGCKF